MSMRYLGGFISASYNPLKVPNAPTIGTVTAGNAQVSVAFTAPSNVGGGAITSYQVLVRDSSSGATFTGTGSASPVVVTGLTNGNTYTAQVAAVNSYGPSAYSASSGSFTYAPKLYAWGSNADGQLGQNNVIVKSSPVQVGALTNWSYVAGGSSHSLATKVDGTLWSWGYNYVGQLGQNNIIYYSSPVQIGALTNWAKVSAGGSTSYAIKTDGTLWSWGYNNCGQLGQNISYTINRSSPVQIGSDINWSSSSCGYFYATAIKTDGTLWAWGYNNRGELGQSNRVYRSSPVQIGALTNWSKIASGTNHLIAVKTDNTLWAWGQNTNGGALGIGDQSNRSSPVQVGALTNWALSGACSYSSSAVKTDGTLWTWGNNDYGRLGLNTSGAYTNRLSPVQVGSLTTWLYVSSSTGYNFHATKTDGTLWGWGNNSNYGTVGDNSTANRSSPVQIGAATSWLSIGAGVYFVLATSN